MFISTCITGDLHDMAQQLDVLQGQVAANTEGVRTLTSTTYKRVDEHASAIQRLTAVSYLP
jgi:hypothetical protein